MESVPFPDGAHSAIFVATSTNKIYAFDATPPFKQRWLRDLGEPYTILNPYLDSKKTQPGNADDRCAWGLMTGIEQDFKGSEKRVMGIESTPVIDLVQRRMFVSYRNNAGPKGVQRFAALDITTGALIPSKKLFFDQWTQRTGAPAAAGEPATMVTTGSQQQHVFYRDARGAINHIFYDGPMNRLFRDQWSQRTGAPAAAGDPATMVTPGQQHIFYRGTNGAINHIFFDEAMNRLFRDQWTQRTGAPMAAGDPATMVTSGPQQHVFYRDASGAINHIFYDGPTNKLFRDQWTQRTGAPAAAGNPATMVTPGQQHIFYRGRDGAINHIFFDEAMNKLFFDQWTQRTGAPMAAGDPATMVTSSPQQQHVFYRDASGAINHIFYDGPTNKLFRDQWTQRTGAPVAAGDPATMVTPGQQHVFYRGTDGAIDHIFYDQATNKLFHDQWTQRAGAPMAAGDPATMVTPNQQHVFYRGVDGAINHIFYDATSVLDREVTSNRTWNQLHRSRASLLLDNGLVFVAYSAVCEDPPQQASVFHKAYQGWVYAFDTKRLDLAGRYRSTQDTVATPPRDPSDDPISGGGIWQASTGLAADGQGNIFFGTGNEFVGEGGRPPSPPDSLGKRLSNSVVRLSVSRDTEAGQGSITANMVAADWFTPYRKVWQDKTDLDLGSAGVVLIPGTRYLVIGGKEGILYLLDRGNLGKFDGAPPFNSTDVLGKHLTAEDKPDERSRDHVVQKLRVAFNQYCSALMKGRYCSSAFVDPVEKSMKGVTMDAWLPWPHIHGTPVFGEFSDGRAYLYIWPEKDHLKSFQWLGNGFQTKPTVATGLSSQQKLLVLAPPLVEPVAYAAGMPGGMLSLTVDPSRAGKGVLFASVQRCRRSDTESARNDCSITLCATAANCVEQHYGMLRAFDPIKLTELWNNQIDVHANEEQKDYWFAKFVPPTIAMGRVYLATASGKVLVYGVVGRNH